MSLQIIKESPIPFDDFINTVSKQKTPVVGTDPYLIFRQVISVIECYFHEKKVKGADAQRLIGALVQILFGSIISVL